LLCSTAWFNLGQQFIKKESILESFLAFVMCGLVNRIDVESWINATIICLQNEEFILFLNDVVNTAYFYCREDYLLRLNEQISKSHKDATPKLLKLIDSLIEKQKEKPIELRILKEDGKFEKHIF